MTEPHTYYVFLIKRPRDSEAWPCVYRDRELAENAYGRVSSVLEVRLGDESIVMAKRLAWWQAIKVTAAIVLYLVMLVRCLGP